MNKKLEVTSALMTTIEQMGKNLTPISEIGSLLGYDEELSEQLKWEISSPTSPLRTKYLHGIAVTANELRCNTLALAQAGSPAAYQTAMSEISGRLNELEL